MPSFDPGGGQFGLVVVCRIVNVASCWGKSSIIAELDVWQFSGQIFFWQHMKSFDVYNR